MVSADGQHGGRGPLARSPGRAQNDGRATMMTEMMPNLRTNSAAWPIRFLRVLVTVAGCAVLLSTAQVAVGADSALACVESWGESRYRNYGYDHIVHIRNR